MPSQPVQLVRFDPVTASEEDWEDHVTAAQLSYQEYYPDIPPLMADEQRLRLQERYANPEIERVTLLARLDGRLAGMFHAEFLRPDSPDYDLYQHIGHMLIYVLPEYRRRGIATTFLEQAVEVATQRNVTDLQTITPLDAGKAFADSLGMVEITDGGVTSYHTGDDPMHLFIIPVDELAAHLGL
jgi:GNAT superfamily N-acetyltransferase